MQSTDYFSRTQSDGSLVGLILGLLGVVLQGAVSLVCVPALVCPIETDLDYPFAVRLVELTAPRSTSSVLGRTAARRCHSAALARIS